MKSMEPKKAKLAILITVIAAILILAICLCLLFEVPLFKKAEEAPQPAVEESAEPEEAPSEPQRAPSEADLAGTADELQHPAPGNYYSEYRNLITRTENSNKSGKVALQLYPAPWKYYRELVMELDGNTPVLGIAQENGYTLVIYKEGIAGWVLSQDLDEYAG